MSRELMAECLEEAGQLWASFWGGYGPDNDLDTSDKGVVATVAVALYVERCREKQVDINRLLSRAWVPAPRVTVISGLPDDDETVPGVHRADARKA